MWERISRSESSTIRNLSSKRPIISLRNSLLGRISEVALGDLSASISEALGALCECSLRELSSPGTSEELCSSGLPREAVFFFSSALLERVLAGDAIETRLAYRMLIDY
jgi:hypothetical protein